MNFVPHIFFFFAKGKRTGRGREIDQVRYRQIEDRQIEAHRKKEIERGRAKKKKKKYRKRQ